MNKCQMRSSVLGAAQEAALFKEDPEVLAMTKPASAYSATFRKS